MSSTTSTTTKPESGPSGSATPATPSKEIPVKVTCVTQSKIDPAVMHVLPGGGSATAVEKKGLRRQLRLPGARMWVEDAFAARLTGSAPVKPSNPTGKIPAKKASVSTVNQSHVYGAAVQLDPHVRNVSITCFTTSRASVTNIALDSTDPNRITSPDDPSCVLTNKVKGEPGRWMYCQHGAVLGIDPAGPDFLGMLALKIHVSLVGFKTVTCTHMCGGGILRSPISAEHYISMPAPMPPKVNTGQTYCHHRFTSRNMFPVPVYTPVQLLVPQYLGWPQHHFICYVQGHLDLPPPECPAVRVPRYQTGNLSAYDFKKAVNDFDFDAMCVGGTHVRKYSSLKPPVITSATTIRAVACTYGGSSAVGTYGFIVVEPPAPPRMILHPSAWGDKPTSKADPTIGYDNNEVADTKESNGLHF